jgi:hypothetical protein
MSINISFHDQQLVEIKVIDNDLTSVNIYDNNKPYGSHITFYFSNPTEVADWANEIATKAHKVNRQYVLDKLGV